MSTEFINEFKIRGNLVGYDDDPSKHFRTTLYIETAIPVPAFASYSGSSEDVNAVRWIESLDEGTMARMGEAITGRVPWPVVTVIGFVADRYDFGHSPSITLNADLIALNVEVDNG